MTKDDEPNYPSGEIDDVDDITFYEDANFIAHDSLSEVNLIHEALTESLEEVRDRESGPDGKTLLTQRERTLLLEYFTVSAAIIEKASAGILSRKLGPEDQEQSAPPHKFYQNEFTQKQREGILYHSGIIDSGLKGELSKVRKRRNDLVHNQLSRKYLEDVRGVEADVDRAYRATKELVELNRDLTPSL